MKDEVFKENLAAIADFEFGEKVASVFDDMLVRSVPFYVETQRMIAEMALDFAVEGTQVYDLGCSTGTTLLSLNKKLPKDIKFIGIDNSEEMLKRCAGKLAEHHFDNTDDMVKEIISARIYGGMHYRTSAVHGSVIARKVASYVAKHYFLPVE